MMVFEIGNPELTAYHFLYFYALKTDKMIRFDKFTLNNGLKVIVHHDATTPMVAFNILYNVGARDENPEKTGLPTCLNT
jgi:predicted Zn-dependent peptidase